MMARSVAVNTSEELLGRITEYLYFAADAHVFVEHAYHKILITMYRVMREVYNMMSSTDGTGGV